MGENSKSQTLNSKQCHGLSDRMLQKFEHGKLVMLNLFSATADSPEENSIP